MPSLRINPQGAARLQDECDSGKQLAIQLGVDRATAWRVLSGRQAPSAKFIAGLILAYGRERFHEIFDAIGA